MEYMERKASIRASSSCSAEESTTAPVADEDFTFAWVDDVINGLVAFVEEFKAGSAIEALKASLAPRCNTKRDNNSKTTTPATATTSATTTTTTTTTTTDHNYHADRADHDRRNSDETTRPQ